MTIDRDLVLRLESLSRVRLSEAERAAAQTGLQAAIACFDGLAALDTAGVEPLTHCFPAANVTREDRVAPSLSNDVVTANAPRAKDGAFMVYRTVE